MFGIGFFELVVIAVVALVFVGPKKLPEVMKQAGRFFVQMRRTANDVKSTFDGVIREAEDEIRREEAEAMRALLAKSATSTTATPTQPQQLESHHPHHHNAQHHSESSGNSPHDHASVNQTKEATDPDAALKTNASTDNVPPGARPYSPPKASSQGSSGSSASWGEPAHHETHDGPADSSKDAKDNV